MSPQLALQSGKAAAFILTHYPKAREWEDPFGTCAWYLHHGFMAMFLHDDGNVAALGSARPVREPADGAIPYKYDMDGDCIFIDLMIAGGQSRTFPGFCKMMTDLLGPRKKVAYFRAPTDKLRIHDYDVFVRNLGRKREPK